MSDVVVRLNKIMVAYTEANYRGTEHHRVLELPLFDAIAVAWSTTV
jgi:hypothetical protein